MAPEMSIDFCPGEVCTVFKIFFFECVLIVLFRKVVASRDSVEPGGIRKCRVHGPELRLELLEVWPEVLGLQH